MSVEKLYASSLLGGGISPYVNIGVKSTKCSNGTVKRVMNACLQGFMDILSLRSQQLVLDVLVRHNHCHKAQTLCIPHFSTDIRDSRQIRWSRRSVVKKRIETRTHSLHKASPLEKIHYDLSMRIWYTLQRCLINERNHGSLLPYTVDGNHGSRNHANFIHLSFDRTNAQRTVRCTLVEPNGPEAAHKYGDGLNRLQQAWKRLRSEGVYIKNTRIHVDPTVYVLGEQTQHTVKDVQRNLHALVGPRTTKTFTRRSKHGHVYKTTMVNYGGFGKGICAAVTHWVIDTWLKRGMSESLDSVYAQMCEHAVTHPQESLNSLIGFMNNVRNRIRERFDQHIQRTVSVDIRRFTKRVSRRYASQLNGGHIQIECDVKLKHHGHELFASTYHLSIA